MNPAQLLTYFDRISEAPDAIPRLRRFVLDLAVRGKLVEQDPKDEPATELLKRIDVAKERLVAAGELRRPRALDRGTAIEAPFVIPTTWRWVRLDAVGAIVGGGTPSAADADNFAGPGEGVPWLTPADLGGFSETYISRGARDLSDKGLRTSSATVMPTGTVLFSSRAPIGYVTIAANPLSTNQGFKSIVPYVPDCSRFIALAMKAFGPEIGSRAPGTTFKEVSGKIVSAVPFPLPPLAEQHRIVAKVDELMALCDRLEAAQAEREQRRDRLAAASLHGLNQPADVGDTAAFREQARFTFGHLPRITTRPEQSKQLRQTILNLAVRGRLVPQDPSGEPASELLKRIQAEKARLVKEGQISKQQPLPPLLSEEIPFQLPEQWQWLRLGEIGLTQTGTTPSSNNPEHFGDYIPFVKPAALTGNTIDYSGVGISKDGVEHSRLIPKHSALMVCIGSSIGKVNVTDRDVCCNQQINAVTPHLEHLTKFTSFALKADYFQKLVLASAGMGTLPIISKGKWEILPIPLPPLAEQHHIVAKVEEVMALCDRLEAQFTAAQTESRRLLESVLHEALAPRSTGCVN